MSGFRRHLMAKLAQRQQQYIFVELVSGTTSFTFRVKLNGDSSYSSITSVTDFTIVDDGVNNPYFYWYIPDGSYLSQISFFDSVNIQTFIGVRFSDNFDFSHITSWAYAFAAELSNQARLQYVDGIQFNPQCENFGYMFRQLGNTLQRITLKQGVVHTTGNAASIDRMFHQTNINLFNGDLSWLSIKEGCNSYYWNTNGAFLPLVNGERQIYAIGSISGTISFQYHSISLASVLVILNALQTPINPQTITFAAATWTKINGTSADAQTARDLIAQKQLDGWTFVSA